MALAVKETVERVRRRGTNCSQKVPADYTGNSWLTFAECGESKGTAQVSPQPYSQH